MKDYQANVPVTLRTGKVKLTDEQLRRRVSEVEATRKKGVYSITGECRFKAGELFSWDGEIPKAMAADLNEPAEVPAPDAGDDAGDGECGNGSQDDAGDDSETENSAES